jgi:hypothetical protein
MAIRFDQIGVFDDRFLGVDVIEEVKRLFDVVGDLFVPEDLLHDRVLRGMVANPLHPHPAVVFRKKSLDRQITPHSVAFDALARASRRTIDCTGI